MLIAWFYNNHRNIPVSSKHWLCCTCLLVSRIFYWFLEIFYIYHYVIYEHSVYSFSICVLYFFSSLIILARTYSMIIDRICERGQPCFVSDLGEESIQFYNIHACVQSHFSHVWLFATLWMVAQQTPLSMGFSRQAYWSRLLCPSLGDLPDRDQTLASCIGRWILYH